MIKENIKKKGVDIKVKKVGILGATGYTGQQLLWLLRNHPNVEIEFIASYSHGGQDFSRIYGNYFGEFTKVCIPNTDVKERLGDIDLLFIALPHGKAFEITQMALDRGVRVVDLGADFRLDDSEKYEEWYGKTCDGKKNLSEAVYGLTELNREKIRESRLVANPGCYPTASLLALIPLLKSGLIQSNSIIIDAKSGVSGAGRGSVTETLMCECSETIKAYAVTTHRHTPEIEQEASKVANEEVKLTFTPHLVPMNRGILSVIYGDLKREIDDESLRKLYEKEYSGEKFIRIKEELPETRWVKGSNYCDISVKVDKRTGRVIVVSAIDNLVKGAAGQAVQNMNLMFGFEEATAIDFISIFP